jgi:hypothetical protein
VKKIQSPAMVQRVQPKPFVVTRVPIKRKPVKKDRFYDKSRDIPNDVYFGDVKGEWEGGDVCQREGSRFKDLSPTVPLHVLHTRWNSDVDSSGSDEAPRIVFPKANHQPRFSSFPSSSKMNFASKVK